MDRGKIIMDVQGGFGNQLFQLFFVINLAKKYGMYIVVPDKKILSTGRSIDVERRTYYELFPRCFNLLTETEIKNLNAIPICETDFKYSKVTILDNSLNYVFKGFYQSPKYFDQNLNILDYLKLPDIDMAKVDEVITNLRSSRKTLVSLHVRRNDYLAHAYFHCVQSIGYYKKAIEALREENILVVIFSDDLSWCKEHFEFIKDKVFVQDKDYIEMMIMSKCDHNIIANSSFSWWGAYMNTNINKKVVYPSKWFAVNHVDTSDLFTPDWIKCDE